MAGKVLCSEATFCKSPTSDPAPPSRTNWYNVNGFMARTFALRVLLFAVAWWALAGSDGGAWYVGVPVIFLAAAWRLGEVAAPGVRLRPWRLVRFVPFFFWRSLVGGCDVAWRALHWRLPIHPQVETYRFRLPPDSPARVLFANCISLLPGTVAATWTKDALRVHVISDNPERASALRQLEEHVGLLFGHHVAAADEEPAA